MARLVKGKAAEAIVAAEFDNDNRRLKGDNRVQTRDRVFRGCTAGADVLDCVAVAELIQITLKRVGIRFTSSKTISGGDAIAKADEDRPIGSDQRQSEKQYQERNDKGAGRVHNNSVAARAGNSRLLLCVS